MSKLQTVRSHTRVAPGRSAIEAAMTARLIQERAHGFRKPRVRVKATSRPAALSGRG